MARIIRICSALALVAAPAAAEARRSEPSAIGLYVRARLAGAAEQSGLVIETYAAALTAAPQSTAIAFRAYRAAIDSGDYPLAVRAVDALAGAGAVPPDGQLLRYVAALRNRDWEEARVRLTDIGRQPGLGFLAPLLARWLSPQEMALSSSGARPNAYVAENEALLALATGNVEDGALAIKAMWTLDPYRAGSLRLAAASQIAARGDKARALSLIVSQDVAAVRAREIIAADRNTGLAVTSPGDGAAFLLARVAGDLLVEGSGRSALTMARLASFAAPANPRIRLIVAGALAARKNHAEALTLAESLLPDPVYGDDAASLRIEQLEAMGRMDEATAGARARAALSANDAARVGDIEMRRGRHAEAAKAYADAATRLGPSATWQLLYAAANAADAAGDWVSAKPLLERALTLAPDEAAILNELGYGLIMRDEDVSRGRSLVARAAELQPDNAAIIDSLGWAIFKKGDIEQAIPLLERADRLGGQDPEIGEHLGDAYWHAGRRIAARYAWSAARVQATGAQAVRLDAKAADGPGRL